MLNKQIGKFREMVGNKYFRIMSFGSIKRKENLNKNVVDINNYLYAKNNKENQKTVEVYTKKNASGICSKATSQERLEQYQEQLILIELTKQIQLHHCSISSTVVDKFKNKNLEKIKEVINRFITEGKVKEVNNNIVYFEHNLQDVLLVIDYLNYIISDIVTYKEKKSIEENSVLIRNDKLKLLDKRETTQIKNEVLLNQLDLICSDIVNEKEAREDIKNNFVSANMDEEKKLLIVNTKNCQYILYHYNIIDVKPKRNFSMSPAEPLEVDDFLEIDKNESNSQYITKKSIEDFYDGKARKYLYRLGLSIKVITKFNTEGNNINELYDFLMEDIIRYGYVLYDNYMENCMIVKTRRFYYLIKNNVVINIRDVNQKPIKECSILFKRVYVKEQLEKTEILDLDVGDKIRDYITYEAINNLQMKKHAFERYKERISKKGDASLIEISVKQDIYKNGVVHMGTYYNNTKLVKGLKNIYIIDNANIISVWRINPVIENIGERYQNLIEEVTLTEIDECDIL